MVESGRWRGLESHLDRKERIVNHRIIASVVTVCLAIRLCAADIAWSDPPVQRGNLIPNASFEKTSDARPAGWGTSTWGGKAEFEYAATGRTGNRCVAIRSEKGADAGWFVVVPVDFHSTYRLSGWIKTENVKVTSARGALLNLHDIQPLATKAVKGTQAWTKVEVVFQTRHQDSVQINCLFGGWGLATGKAYFDDLHLEQLSRKEWKPVVSIDADKTGEPISKYIYGQFIEHLGRCIYGGIWAEMLQDRKFWFPIAAKYDPYGGNRRASKDAPFPVVAASPWQIIGEPDAVKMVKEDSFVGDHTPLVAPGGGIRQRDLGLVKDKPYEGYIWLKPSGDKATVEVSLQWGEGPEGRQQHIVTSAADDYQKSPFRFTAADDTNQGILGIKVLRGGPCFVGTVSLMPADNVDGMRADTLKLLKDLDSPVYRWPGGNFVSGYDWRDGIGDRDRRPPRKNPAWTGVEHNDFGLDEFTRFCRILDTDPYIAVNSGLGNVDGAIAELQYANGGADTPMGKLRAQNGHPEPYKVKFWGIGNEMYGGWQLGHMPLEKYVKKHNVFAEAFRKEDPSITVVAVGAVGKWSEGMMTHCAEHMDLVSEHFYRQGRQGLAGHVHQVPDAVRSIAEAHRRYRREFESLNGKDIRIALDEWNYWYGPHVFGELGTRYFLKDGLGIAAGLHEFARNSDIYYMGNYAQTVNVIGCIKTSRTSASLATTGLVLKLYRKQFGVIPVQVTAPPPLDVAAAWTADRKQLTVAVVNPTVKPLELPLTIAGVKLSGKGRQWQIAGEDPMAYNEPGKAPKVTIKESAAKGIGASLSVPPCSVTLYALDVE